MAPISSELLIVERNGFNSGKIVLSLIKCLAVRFAIFGICAAMFLMPSGR
jgi:hypothetical protein